MLKTLRSCRWPCPLEMTTFEVNSFPYRSCSSVIVSRAAYRWGAILLLTAFPVVKFIIQLANNATIVVLRSRSPSGFKSWRLKLLCRWFHVMLSNYFWNISFQSTMSRSSDTHFHVWPKVRSSSGQKRSNFENTNFLFKHIYLIQFCLRIPKMSFVLSCDN